jgi:hypothetical protein
VLNVPESVGQFDPDPVEVVLAVSVVLCPAQMLVLVVVIVGFGTTVIVCVAEQLVPLASVTVHV